MIIAIADDITGAAEICGIAWRQGLKVSLSDSVQPADADLLVVYTNTRSLPVGEAASTMHRLAKEAAALEPEWVYKKTDSVLRGHVAKELEAMLQGGGWKQVLLVPVNPQAGRIIRDGRYLVNGQPLNKTGFADDPEFPATTADVRTLLASEQVALKRLDEDWTAATICIGEADSSEALVAWAQQAAEFPFLAGGGAFFEALLRQRAWVDHPIQPEAQTVLPLLLVSGTKFGASYERLLVKPNLFLLPLDVQEQNAIVSELKTGGVARLGFARDQKADANRLRLEMARTTSEVFERVMVRELIIEGGSTAYSIVQQLGLRQFLPVLEWAPGVVRLRCCEQPVLHLTIKPGSYPWPESLNF